MKILNVKHTSDKTTTKEIRKHRLNYKDEWIQLNIHTANGVFRFKCYNTTIQEWKSPEGSRATGGWDMTVKEFNDVIIEAIRRQQKNF